MATVALTCTAHTGVYPGGWIPPQGMPLVVPVGEPALGTEWSWQAPKDRLVKVKSVRYKLTTGVTVATRQPLVQLTDQNGTVIANTGSPGKDAASVSVTTTWAVGLDLDITTLANQSMPLPELLLPYGGEVKSVVTGLQATDQLSTIVLLVELY